jgi:hypothetical protein
MWKARERTGGKMPEILKGEIWKTLASNSALCRKHLNFSRHSDRNSHNSCDGLSTAVDRTASDLVQDSSATCQEAVQVELLAQIRLSMRILGQLACNPGRVEHPQCGGRLRGVAASRHVPGLTAENLVLLSGGTCCHLPM